LCGTEGRGERIEAMCREENREDKQVIAWSRLIQEKYRADGGARRRARGREER
jgi:hypothetical protein